MEVLGCLIDGHTGCKECSSAAKSAARLQRVQLGCKECSSAARVQLAATAAMHGRDSILLDFAAPDKAADKKAAPTWGKPGAGAAEVNNAQTQLKTNASHHFAITTSLLRGVSGAACLSRQCYIVVTSRHPHGSDRADATLATH
jgi:hypothetical protein